MVPNMTQKLPSDALTKPTRRLPWILSIIGGITIATAAAIAGPSISANLNPATVPSPTPTEYVATLTPAEIDTVEQQAELQAAKIAADQAAAEKAAADAAAAQAAAHQTQSGDGQIKCAAGYSANAVDAAGNESNCQKNGPRNKPCVAYNDDNVCTAYEE